MSEQVKVAHEGTATDRHARWTLATYEYSPATGWRRIERFDDEPDVRHLPGSDGWTSNAPGARFKETCRICNRTPEFTWDELTLKLDAARAAGKRRVTLS
ncbi:MAG: hypothetical protein JWP57_4512 [Spirosoma sp.]|nr:hypothetical protein [Spirosoma sp.]